MAKDQIQTDIEQTFYAAEQTGLKLAIKGRLVALLVVGLWLVPTRGAERATDIVLALLVLAALGIFHFLLIGSAWDRKWVKYVFVTIDLALFCVAVAVLPPEPAMALPQIFMFKFDIYPYLFIILGVAAFSFSPGLVLWSGLVGAGGWLAAYAWVLSGMSAPLEWADALADGTQEHFLRVFLSEDFVGTGSRAQEAIVYLTVAVLIAVVMQRARQTVRRQLEAEQDKATVTQIFGRFVPGAVAASMIEDRGALDPVERQATVMFIDIAGFTNLTESKGPAATVGVLNAYFDAATEIIGRYDGVVTQFQGDAILAVFNVPIENPAHARCAYDAAREILDKVRDGRFAGERLAVRIGLNSGPLVAGNVGGGGRQTYTVHGDTVNLAARLEALNKQHGTSILVSQSTAALLPDANLRAIGAAEIKGLSAPVGIYTSDTPPSTAASGV
ncbi:MAG: adenylate/guanylate cyclase domain-containing protein [Hyphomicrobiales bacterium]|nr:adenylate/guanylate cyclase domain-containing protein [Hyphomicrobiales bacterium]MCP5371283.1 adenylate/guanylate cyclase domain-containing protein [Hyphomicrobiales bacterium]